MMKCCKDCKYCVDTFVPIPALHTNKPLTSHLECSHKDFTNIHYDPVKGTTKSFTECELALKRCKFDYYSHQNWFVVKFVTVLLATSSLIGYLCFVLNH